MKLISSREIMLDMPLWEPELFGIFKKYNDDVCFYFLNRQTLYVFSESQLMPDVLLHCPDNHFFALPYKWQWIDLHASSFLLLSESLGIDIIAQRLVSPLPADLLVEYKTRVFREKHFEEDNFEFNDYCISHKGTSGYRCTKLGKHLWDFQGRAYLYTEIIQYQKYVFFGTGGHGGYFYVLELDTGKVIASLKTGGTACIAQKDNLCFFLRCDGKTELVCFDLQSGQIVNSIMLSGKASLNSRLQIIDNAIHTVTFRYRKDCLQSAIWHTIQI